MKLGQTVWFISNNISNKRPFLRWKGGSGGRLGDNEVSS